MHVVTSRQTWGRCLISPITGGAGETNDGLSDSERITGDTGSRCGWRQVTTDAPKQPDRIFRESYLVIWNHWGGSLRARTSVNISTGVCGGQVGGQCTCWSWRGGGTVGRAVGVWLLQEVTVEAALTWSTQRHTAHTNDGRSMGGGRGGGGGTPNNTTTLWTRTRTRDQMTTKEVCTLRKLCCHMQVNWRGLKLKSCFNKQTNTSFSATNYQKKDKCWLINL